jgi:hypothetical protein
MYARRTTFCSGTVQTWTSRLNGQRANRVNAARR